MGIDKGSEPEGEGVKLGTKMWAVLLLEPGEYCRVDPRLPDYSVESTVET